MIKETLKKLGLSPAEIKIYLYLTAEGASYSNKISKDTKLHRTNVYEAVDRLISKGLVSSIKKNNITWFEANKPTSLFKLVDEQQEALHKIKQQLKEQIQTIAQRTNKQKIEASIFVGKKGLRMLFEDILETGKPISLIAAHLQFQKIFGPYFELWHTQRIEKKILQRTIFPLLLRNKVKSRKYLQYKFVSNQFTNPTTTIIYGTNCLFIQWEDEPFAIKIESKAIVQSHLNYFNMLWRKGEIKLE